MAHGCARARGQDRHAEGIQEQGRLVQGARAGQGEGRGRESRQLVQHRDRFRRRVRRVLRGDPGRHRHGRHDAAYAGTDHATGRREPGQARVPRARVRRRRRHRKSPLPQGALDISRSRRQGTAARAVQAVRHPEAWPRPVLRASRHRLREELRRRHALAGGDAGDFQRRTGALLPGNCGCDVGRLQVRHCHADARERRRRRHQDRGNHRHDGARGRGHAAHPGCGSQGMDPARRDA